MIEEKPVIISDKAYKLFGIIREARITERVVILSPWVLGDRTGVTRIYVEMAREFQRNNITTLCVDIPPINYCIDDNFKYNQYVEMYIEYLEKVVQYMQDLYPRKEITIVGYCSSSIQAVYVARKHNLAKVITLNAFNYPESEVKKPVHETLADYIKYHNNKIDMLHIFSEKEDLIWKKREYLQNYFEDDNCNVTVDYIMATDHTFDGWNKKRELIEKLLHWILK